MDGNHHLSFHEIDLLKHPFHQIATSAWRIHTLYGEKIDDTN